MTDVSFVKFLWALELRRWLGCLTHFTRITYFFLRWGKMEIKGYESPPLKLPKVPPLELPKVRCSLGSSSGFRYGSLVNSVSSLAPDAAETGAISPRRAYLAIAVLCYINLLNYMERYTIAGWMIWCWTLLCFQPLICSHLVLNIIFFSCRCSFWHSGIL